MEFSSELVHRVVYQNRVGVAADEAAAVEEHDDGQADDVVRIAASGGWGWVVEAEPEVARRVDGCVGGGNAIGRDFVVEEVEEATIDAPVVAE